jgi:hypothetical protein
MTGAVLQPQPDPHTGEPHPPRAPTVVGAWAGHRKRGRRTASFRPARGQDRFTTSAPMLELVEARRRRALLSVAFYSVYIALTLTAGLALVMSGPANASLRADPVPYAIGAAIWAGSTTLAYLNRRTHTVYAGAGWVGDSEDREKIVSTYDLTRIRIFDASGPGAILQMIGKDGVFLQLPIGLLEGSQKLWDLIYNGLRHSAATGAQVDPATRELLHLPTTCHPPA